MWINVMLCISFVVGAAAMYISLKKVLDLFAQGLGESEQVPAVSEKAQVLRPEEAEPARVPVPDGGAAAPKPRIPLRTSARNGARGAGAVLVGNAKPYRVSIRRA